MQRQTPTRRVTGLLTALFFGCFAMVAAAGPSVAQTAVRSYQPATVKSVSEPAVKSYQPATVQSFAEPAVTSSQPKSARSAARKAARKEAKAARKAAKAAKRKAAKSSKRKSLRFDAQPVAPAALLSASRTSQRLQFPGDLKQSNAPRGPFDFNAVHMADAYRGFAVGDGGVILKTEDGGRSWTHQASGTTEDLLGVDALDGFTAYAVGEADTILRTDDGGRSWRDPRWYPGGRSSGVVLTDVHMLSENTAVVVGGTARSSSSEGYGYLATYLRTTDGGISWTTPSYPDDLERINSIDFMDDQVGIAVGGCLSYSPFYGTYTISSIVTRTFDGGITWTKEESPFDIGPEAYGIEPWGKRVWDVAFYDEVHAAIVAGDGVPIALSSDQGGSWSATNGSICGFEEQSITYVDADTLVAVGEGSVIRSTDGGLRWEFVHSIEGDVDCFCLKSVSAWGDTVVAVGCDSIILRSDDGGATWEEITL